MAGSIPGPVHCPMQLQSALSIPSTNMVPGSAPQAALDFIKSALEDGMSNENIVQGLKEQYLLDIFHSYFTTLDKKTWLQSIPARIRSVEERKMDC